MVRIMWDCRLSTLQSYKTSFIQDLSAVDMWHDTMAGKRHRPAFQTFRVCAILSNLNYIKGKRRLPATYILTETGASGQPGIKYKPWWPTTYFQLKVHIKPALYLRTILRSGLLDSVWAFHSYSRCVFIWKITLPLKRQLTRWLKTSKKSGRNRSYEVETNSQAKRAVFWA
jgi:hypothetical protein